MSRIALLAIGALALTAVPASAQTPNDVRCLLVSNVFAKAGKAEKERKIAEATMYFYLGRIAGRFSDAQLKAAFDAQQKAIKGMNGAPIMTACARNMTTSASKVQTLSQSAAAKR